MSRSLLLITAAGLMFCAACRTIPVQSALASSFRLSPNKLEGDPAVATQKIFTVASDWNIGGITMKKGAEIVFQNDGTGIFLGRIYADQAPPWQQIQLHALQFGKDGNRLFNVPGNESGFVLYLKSAQRDYIWEQRFGFDARYFPVINSSMLQAICPTHAGHAGFTENFAGNPK